jgi:dTDP-4-dehydrorhamnose reductase
MKCMDIPVITGATGILTKCLRKNLEAISGKHSSTTENSCTWNITRNTESAAV